jgi:transposase
MYHIVCPAKYRRAVFTPPVDHSHINGIEGFWGMAKTRLVKFRGLCRSTFYLHLKECEFRFNHRDEDLYQLLLKITRSALAI